MTTNLTREQRRAQRELRNVRQYLRRELTGELTGWTKGDRHEAAAERLRAIDADHLTDAQLEVAMYLQRWAVCGKDYADDHAARTDGYRIEA